MGKTLCRLALALLTPCISVTAEEVSNNNDIMVKPFTAEYTILRKSDPIGTGIRQLEHLGNNKLRYTYHSELNWLIFSDDRVEESIVKIENDHIFPVHYFYERTGTGKDKKFEWEYDHKANTALDVEKGKKHQISFPDNLQDSLSYHLQHRLNLINNPEQKHFVYPVIKSSGKIKNYVYQYDGEEEIMLPYGLVKTIRLKREVVEKQRVTYAWFAPELNYLLVKLYQTKGGVEQLEAQLKSVTINQ